MVRSRLSRTIARLLRVFSHRYKKLSYLDSIKLELAPNSYPVRVKVGSHHILIRKGTPDLDVAMSCLAEGEFDESLNFLPADFEGVIVDAGGYIGTSALALAELFPNAQVVTVEPSEENLAILKRNVKDVPRIRVIAGALVGSAEISKVAVSDRGTGHWGHTVVRDPLDQENPRFLNFATAFRLDQLGVDVSDIGFLKLDIEGGEYDLLVNDSEFCLQIPVIFVELHDRIVDGCSEAFFDFSRNRKVTQGSGEKFFSVQSAPL
jgi:FkbM family methyltransferase